MSNRDKIQFILTKTFYNALVVENRAHDEEDAPFYRSQADLAREAAFTMASTLGWDLTADEDWLTWCLKATEPEILTEGLRRALELCTADFHFVDDDNFVFTCCQRCESQILKSITTGSLYWQCGHAPETGREALLEEAQDAFWAVVAKGHPEVRTGDLPPEIVAQFDQQCEVVVAYWAKLNAPSPARRPAPPMTLGTLRDRLDEIDLHEDTPIHFAHCEHHLLDIHLAQFGGPNLDSYIQLVSVGWTDDCKH